MQNVPIRAAGEALPAVNRRAFLRTSAGTAAGAAAASAVAIIAVPSSAAEHPDAELVALGSEFDRLYATNNSLNAKVHEVHQAYLAARPVSTRDLPNDHPFWNDWITECAPFEREMDTANDSLNDLCERIRTIPATSLAGFAVKARMLRYDMAKPGDNPAPMEDWDWDDECLERFIRELERAGGASHA